MNIEPKLPTGKGPAEWFTGDVWMDVLAARKPEPSRMCVNLVRFAPGARTAWHSHPGGQTLHVTQGVAWMGLRNGTVLEVPAGQTVHTPPGEEHWHGAPARTTSWSTSRCGRRPPTAVPNGANM